MSMRQWEEFDSEEKICSHHFAERRVDNAWKKQARKVLIQISDHKIVFGVFFQSSIV